MSIEFLSFDLITIVENASEVAYQKSLKKCKYYYCYLFSVLSSREIFVFWIFHEKNSQEAARDHKTLGTDEG